MTIYSTLTFEDSTNGQAPVMPTGWSALGSGYTASTAAAVHGTLGVRWADMAAYGPIEYSGTGIGSSSLVLDLYITVRSASAATAIGELRTATSGGSVIGQLRVMSDRTLQLRNGFTAVAASTETLAVGTTYRLVWSRSGGTQTATAYVGESTTPAFTISGALATTAGGALRVGATSAGGLGADIDTVRIADAPLDPYAPVVATHTHFTVRGGQLRPMNVTRATAAPVAQSVAWSHYDDQARTGQPANSNPAFESLEWAMKDRMGSPPTEPIGSFIHGYSGSDFPSTFQSSSVSSAPTRGVGAMLNVKRGNWSALANGDYDGTITSFFNSWPVDTFGSFTINHEPENDGPSPANPSNSAYVDWASVNGPIWSQGIARTIAVAAPIIRARGLDVKLGGCLMDFSWDTTRWTYWDWWNYVNPTDFDVTEFQIDAYAKTDVINGEPVGHDLIPRIMECYQHALDVGINHLSIFETAIDRRERNNGDVLVGTDESVAVWWENYVTAIEAIPGARLMAYFSIPTGPASGQAAIRGRGLDVFRDICLNGRRP